MIADAGMRIIARDGLRALTHRAVDCEAGLAQGSSSYYVPTRSALIELIVRALAERSVAEAEEAARGLDATLASLSSDSRDAWIKGLAAAVVSLIDAFAAREVEMRTRYALLLELDRADPVRAELSERSPAQQRAVAGVVRALDRFGVSDATARAAELVGLSEALLAHRVILGANAAAPAPVVSAYLRGLPVTTEPRAV